MSGARTLRWSYLGRVDYVSATRLQGEIRDGLIAGTGAEHLVLLEHPHVYTLGRSASGDDVVASRAWLDEREVEIAETDRGGQVTYHGPGQLVGYPILDLSPDRRDLRRYVRDLQQVLVRTLADFGVEGRAETQQSLIGVWVGKSKVASIGVHVSRWVTTHGFALNVSTDLDYFTGIVPCGLPNVRMASVESITGQRYGLDEVAERLAGHFGEQFGRDLERFDGLGDRIGAGSELPAEKRGE